jgi:hypothetical protein
VQKTFRSLLALVTISAVSLLTIGTPHAAPQETGGEVTKANWQQHPKIKQVRSIVQAVKAGMSNKSFSVRKRVFEYCEPYEDTERTLATDSRGRARFYKNAGGSDDSSLAWEHYYDETGRLRFVFITGGAVNGSQLEHRIYYDEMGKRIWEEQAYKKGPGYTFPAVWPDDQLQITDAAGKFSSASPCPESKPRAGRRGRAGM